MLGLNRLGAVVLAHGLQNWLFLLGFDDGDGIGKRLLGSGLALWVAAAHDLDLDTENTLTEENVTGGRVDEFLGGVTGVDHEAILDFNQLLLSPFSNIVSMCYRFKTYSELHGLSTGSTELAGDDNLATLSTALHDEPENTIACPTDGKTVEQLVTEGLALSDSGETTVLDLGGVQRDRVLGEPETLLDERGELANAAALLAQNLLGVGGTDD